MHGVPFALLGFRVTGDIGGVSVWTDRHGRKTLYPIAPPKHPASTEQALFRTRFGQAVAAWKALTPTQKENLENACRMMSLRLTGQNLYVSAALKNMNANVQAIARQTGLTLPTVPYIPH